MSFRSDGKDPFWDKSEQIDPFAPKKTLGISNLPHTVIDVVTPPYDIPEKLMKQTLFEPPITPYYFYDFF